MKKLNLLFFMLLIFLSCSGDKNKISNTKETSIENIKKIILSECPYMKEMKKDDELEIIYFGKTSKGLHICQSILTWNQRQTRRIIVLSSNFHYLGNYGGFAENAIKLENDILIFPFDEKYGNKIDFTQDKILEEVYLDGENPMFDRSLE